MSEMSEMSEWISIGDRLPKRGGYSESRSALLWHKTSASPYKVGYAVGDFNGNAEMVNIDHWIIGGLQVPASLISHWRDLPEPPK